MRWWNSNTDSTDLNLSKLQEILEDGRGWCAACHVVAKKNGYNSATEQQQQQQQ